MLFPRFVVEIPLCLAMAAVVHAQTPGGKLPAPGSGVAPAAQAASAGESWRVRLDQIENLIDSAHFKQALERVDEARGVLARPGAAPLPPAERARLDVLGGTVAVALGLHREALQSFARAIAAEPGLALPPDTSPKVQRVFDAARRAP